MSEGISVSELSDKQFREKAKHIWLNGFMCIKPTDDFLISIGREIIRQVNESEIRDSMGISKYTILTVNIS